MLGSVILLQFLCRMILTTICERTQPIMAFSEGIEKDGIEMIRL